MGVFGDEVRPADDAAPAEWLPRALGALYTVAAFVPEGYERVLRVALAEGDWHAGADLVAACARHTSTPERTWFAVSDVYGFVGGRTLLAVRGTGLAARVRAIRLQRQMAREEAARDAVVGRELTTIPTFELPLRRYYLLTGTIDAARTMRYLDLWWPDDRSWFVATDTDLDWCYVAGTTAFTDAVAAALPGRTRPVDRADPVS